MLQGSVNGMNSIGTSAVLQQGGEYQWQPQEQGYPSQTTDAVPNVDAIAFDSLECSAISNTVSRSCSRGMVVTQSSNCIKR